MVVNGPGGKQAPPARGRCRPPRNGYSRRRVCRPSRVHFVQLQPLTRRVVGVTFNWFGQRNVSSAGFSTPTSLASVARTFPSAHHLGDQRPWATTGLGLAESYSSFRSDCGPCGKILPSPAWKHGLEESIDLPKAGCPVCLVEEPSYQWVSHFYKSLIHELPHL